MSPEGFSPPAAEWAPASTLSPSRPPLPMEAKPLSWKVTYSSRNGTDLAGTLYLRAAAKRVVLLDAVGVVIDARFLIMGESIRTGHKIELSCHSVLIQEQVQDPMKSSKAKSPPPRHPSAQVNRSDLSSVDSKPGLDLLKQAWRRLKSPITPLLGVGGKAFFLVASFARSKFKLAPVSVGLLLQSCLGGIAADFDVLWLRDRSYRFSVSCKEIGFFIHNLRSFS